MLLKKRYGWYDSIYNNKAVIAEGVKPILPLRWEFFMSLLSYPFSLEWLVQPFYLMPYITKGTAWLWSLR